MRAQFYFWLVWSMPFKNTQRDQLTSAPNFHLDCKFSCYCFFFTISFSLALSCCCFCQCAHDVWVFSLSFFHSFIRCCLSNSVFSVYFPFNYLFDILFFFYSVLIVCCYALCSLKIQACALSLGKRALAFRRFTVWARLKTGRHGTYAYGGRSRPILRPDVLWLLFFSFYSLYCGRHMWEKFIESIELVDWIPWISTKSRWFCEWMKFVAIVAFWMMNGKCLSGAHTYTTHANRRVNINSAKNLN